MPSIRESVAQNLADTCVFGGLNDAYGVLQSKEIDAKGKSYRSVTFCKARSLDGWIKVYSPTFILISWQTARRDLPTRGREVCRSEGEAKQVLAQFISN